MKKIQFFSTIPGVAEACPIIPASKYITNWQKRAREDYKASSKRSKGRMDHIAQCPGIFDLNKHGYILPMWHDVLIETMGDGKEFKWTVPTSDIHELAEGKEIISKQQTGVETLMPVKPWSMTSLIKFNTPWNVIAPKGVKFIMIPIAYPDSFELESSIGILDPSVSTELNVQAFYNIPKGEYLLKAGTPLAQIIPLSEQQFELVVRDKNASDELWLKKKQFIMNFTFKIKRNLVQDIYNKQFGGK